MQWGGRRQTWFQRRGIRVAELHELTIHEAASGLRAGEFSSEELTRAVLDRIERVEPRVQAYIAVDADRALAMAREADERLRAEGESAPALCGIPLALKDNLCTTDFPTTCASKILRDFRPPYDAHVVERLRAAGAVLLGKTNMDEFAMGSSTENSGLHPTANPWDLERIPGGSSGGSAAAVAACEALGALGSDTGGSIRQPAALCGVVGMKPTYGRVSRYGLVAFGSSLDQIGPITRDVEDCAILLDAISGHDERDSTSAPVDVPDFRSFLNQDVRGMKIGIPKEYFAEGMDAEVARAMDESRTAFESLGAELVDVSLPHTDYAVATYYLVATAEASSNLARYDGAQYGHRAEGTENIIDMFSRTRREGFGDEVKRRIMLGTYVLSAGFYDAYYLKALKVRTLIKRDFERAYEKVDAILTPTSPTPAFRKGEKMDDPLHMYLSDIYTISTNLAGIPGVSVPAAVSTDGLPIGLQLMAPNFEEGRLLRAAHAFEREAQVHATLARL
ncbi:Asp-tRNA(Asn)/Glu-tRNA(Gln) amidotransferase subunit GatA [Candidatus Sumerlaeota bacterium]|nr:Asp-tRNA(Asn)/Glu-tRNA(Gln) amidotransferase subunit GatA [Candidatus Sumerlaeota bacterium]